MEADELDSSDNEISNKKNIPEDKHEEVITKLTKGKDENKVDEILNKLKSENETNKV